MLEIQKEKEDRGSFWSMNLTMALNNFETIVKRVLAALGLEHKTSNANSLSQALDLLESQPQIYQAKIERLFVRTLPHLAKFRQFIETGEQKSSANGAAKTGSGSSVQKTQTSSGRDFTKSDLFNLLRYYAASIHELRNYFAHSDHALPQWDYPLNVESVPFPAALETAFFNANIRTVKELFYQDGTSLPQTLVKGFLSLRAKLKNGPNPNFRYRLTEKNDEDGQFYPTLAGLAFFVARFLEKRYVDLLFETKDERGFPVLPLFQPRDVDGVAFSLAPRRVYGVAVARLPRRRVETNARPESSPETLGLDVLSYLARCPQKIYELLLPSDRRKFRVEAEDLNPLEGLRVRSEKRFPYLAALCLDHMKSFEKLRFQIDMGQYFSAVHRRRLIDGTTISDRRVGKRVFWFERIQNAVDYYRAERLKPESKYFVRDSEEETAPETDYRVDAYPRYRVKNQQLGIRFVDSAQTNAHPELIPWTHSSSGGARKTRTLPPEFWLSQYELPSLLFVALHGKGRDAERLIADYQKNWRRFLEDVRDGRFDFGDGRTLNKARLAFESEYGLRFADLPDAMQALFRANASDVASRETQNVEAATFRATEAGFERLIDETKRRLSELGSSSTIFKLGSRQRPNLTSGRAASWLVRDLMRFQYATSEKSFGKISSSPDYNALQAALATFDSRKPDELLNLFKAAKLISANFAKPRDAEDAFYFEKAQNAERSLHPFLSAVVADAVNLRDWKSFYRAYLKYRLEWLRQGEPEELYPARRLARRWAKRQNMRRTQKRQDVARQLATRLLKQPINLPRGLFTALVRDVVAERFGERLAEATNNGATPTNASWLVARFRDWSGDASQDYYGWRRNYGSVGAFKRLFELCAPFPSTSPLDLRALKKAFDNRFSRNYAVAFAKQLAQAPQRRQFKQEALAELKAENPRRRVPENEIDDLARQKQNQYDESQRAQRRQAEHAKIRQISNWEHDIRHTEIQDYVLALAASHLLFEGDLTKIRLADAYSIVDDATGTFETNPLRKLRPCEVWVDVPPFGSCKIRGEMNVKNCGNLQRFLTDGRLPSFLQSLRRMEAENAQELSYNDLAREFAESDRTERGRIFDAIYRFETACFQRFPELKDKRKKEGYVDFVTILTTVFPNDEETQYLLLVIRNKLMHQEYPIYDAFQARAKPTEYWKPIFDRWNAEMWAAYDPVRRPLCRCVADWAEPRFAAATARVLASR